MVEGRERMSVRADELQVGDLGASSLRNLGAVVRLRRDSERIHVKWENDPIPRSYKHDSLLRIDR